MFIIDFRNKQVSDNRFSIMGNNNVDKVWFYSHFTEYATGYNVYLKIVDSDDTYADKILIDSENISIVDNALLVKWTMGEVSTQCKKINVQLQFENTDGSIIAQTRIVDIVLGDTLNIDEKIGHIYPKVLQRLQEQITELKGDSACTFDMTYVSDTLTITLYNKANSVIATKSVTIPTSDKISEQDADDKYVAKVSETNKVYTTNGVLAYDVNATANALVLRDNNGFVYVPLTPTQEGHAISKKYFDTIIDEIEQRSDVVDIVGTYAELEAYDTSHLSPNSLIKVINDETRDNAITYYRWVVSEGVGTWTYVATEGAFFTKSQSYDIFLTKSDASNTYQKKIYYASIAPQDAVDNDVWVYDGYAKIYKSGVWKDIANYYENEVIVSSSGVSGIIPNKDVPSLTSAQVLDAYNQFVSGKVVIIESENDEHFIVKEVKADNDDVVIYFDFDELWTLQYTLSNDVEISAYKAVTSEELEEAIENIDAVKTTNDVPISLKFWVGTQDEYDELTPSNDTLYYIIEE